MKLKLNNFINYNFFVLYLVILSLKHVNLEELCKADTCKSILMKGKIIFIKDSENDITINYYDFDKKNSSLLQDYSTRNIKRFKNIIKISDKEFVIFGVNRESGVYIFYYDIYAINENSGNFRISHQSSGQRNFNLVVISQFEAKIIFESKKLLIYGIINDFFMTYLIDLQSNSNNYFQYQFPENGDIDSRITYSGYALNNIQCSSVNGINFFCLFYFNTKSGKESFPMYYLNGNFNNDSETKIIRNICFEQCVNGNIEAINNERYLLCYQQKVGGNFYTLCRYFIYSSNYFEEGDEVYQLFTPNYKTFNYMPLIINKYENTIFILFNYNTIDNEFAYIIILSFDFKINLDLKLLSLNKDSLLSTINFFNDENYVYHIYEDFSGDTLIDRTEFIKCQPSENLILSVNKESIPFNFTKGHEGMEIRFSINENLHLNPTRNYYNPSSNSDNNFIFKRKDNSGVFSNYYIYSNTVNFSLVCALNITSCYSLCDTCTYNKEPTDNNHYCKNCITGYYPKEDESGNNAEDFNCYKGDELIMYYYKDTNTNYFKKCKNSCKYCGDPNSCKACNEGYYFKFEDNTLKNDNICFIRSLKDYYLSTNENIENSYMNFKETIDTVYRRCYKTCDTCLNGGSESYNNCIDCKTPFQKYAFNQHQCLINHETECFNKQKYWEIKNNNITCKDDCIDSIILYGENKAQCVLNCSDFVNPYATNTMFFTLVNCNNKNYCIPLDVCRNGKFEIFYENKTCIRKTECNINIFDGTDPFIHDYDTIIPTTIEIPTIIPDKPLTPDEKRENILRRTKLVKILDEDEDNYYLKYNKSDNELIQEYIQLFNKYSEGYEKDGIYLLILKRYKNFNITIYPIDVETFAYDNVITPNNLGFIDFENYLQGYFDYEVGSNEIILVILLESLSLNSSINELNYYFYSLNENHNERSRFINIFESDLILNDNLTLKTMYPLKNYYNENSTLEKRNTEYLVDNIKSFYLKDPNIELYNINDPFFNDICCQFSSEINTDVTLNDRREEYYVNKSLCEDNCYLEKLIIKDDYVKSLCLCQIKSEFNFNKNAGIKDDIPLISINIAKSVFCYENAFNSQTLAKNPIFWVFLVLIIFFFIMFFVCVFYGNSILNKILNYESSGKTQEISENIEIKETGNNIVSLDKENEKKINSDDNNITDIKEPIQKYSITNSKSLLNSKLVINKKKSISRNINNINNIKSFSKNSSIYEFNVNNNKKDSVKKIKSIQLNMGSSNTDKSNPPRKDGKHQKEI